MNTPDQKKVQIINLDHWKNALASNYNFYKGLVNVEGEPVAEDFEDQADMCEIVRALIANGNTL